MRPLRFVLSSYFLCNEMPIFFPFTPNYLETFWGFAGHHHHHHFLILVFYCHYLLLLLSLTFHFLAEFFLTTLSKGLEFERSLFRAMNWWCKSLKSITCFNFVLSCGGSVAAWSGCRTWNLLSRVQILLWPLAGFVPNPSWLYLSAALVYRQPVCLLPVAILNLLSLFQ